MVKKMGLNEGNLSFPLMFYIKYMTRYIKYGNNSTLTALNFICIGCVFIGERGVQRYHFFDCCQCKFQYACKEMKLQYPVLVGLYMLLKKLTEVLSQF